MTGGEFFSQSRQSGVDGLPHDALDLHRSKRHLIDFIGPRQPRDDRWVWVITQLAHRPTNVPRMSCG